MASRGETPRLRTAPSKEAVSEEPPPLRKAASSTEVSETSPPTSEATTRTPSARSAPPVRVAPKAAAGKAKTAMKVAAPARVAAKTRVAPVMKAGLKLKLKSAPKAVAYKPFAKVAAKAKAKSSMSPLGSGTWFFMKDLRKTKEGHDDPKAWQKFDAKMSAQLEKAYSSAKVECRMTFKGRVYVVKFKSMMQFRADDKSLQRPVKRE
eukprot:TRINITY_DN69161_c0_g1_i1.p1 TRINITY_DN69161_c0_g1~~TRINITY_DN69161_c0_g1_i1.p1  ORF type:complete len:229 (+),score=53.44 TRINITY_DN69161_c0_g1_i1:68-688(+)